LRAYLTSRPPDKANDWAAKVGHFLAGQLGESDFLAAAKDPDSAVEAGQLCEAFFYAASRRLFVGDRPTAIKYLEKSIATEKENFYEYASAKAELKFLNPQKD